jgi:fibro-slime domain-containing protein
MVGRAVALVAAAVALALATGCADVKSHADATGSSTGAAGTGPPLGDGAAGREAGNSLADALGAPPIDFTMAETGGYKRGDQLAINAMSGPGSGPKVCNTIVGVVRDFKGALPAAGGSLQPGGHPDFEVFEGRGKTLGIVAPELGADGKPVYVSKCEGGAAVSAMCPFGAMTTTKTNFDQWYRSIDGVNIPFLIYLQLVPGLTGIPTFESGSFFPMDGGGWGNNGIGKDKAMKDVPRNFAFTTEVHTKFKYLGGEHFNFKGDDDVWVFINHKLAVDLGGLHFPEAGTVDLDAQAGTLGITKGGPLYDLDLFHAERHSIDSNFRIEMNFTFEDCGYVVP